MHGGTTRSAGAPSHRQSARSAAARIALALWACACGDPARAAGSAHLQRGDAQLAAAKPQHAIAEYTLALKSPVREDAVLRLASAYSAVNEFAKAEQFLREASQKQPTDPGLRLSLARALAATGRTRQAFAEARQLLQIVPGNVQALTLMAAFASTPDEARLAADKLEAWSELEAHRNAGRSAAELQLPLALLRQQLGQAEAATRARDAAARSGIQDLPLALALADSYRSIARLLPAEELLELAAKRAPERAATWQRLAAVRASLREWPEASAALAKLDARAAAEPETTLIDAEIQLGLGRPSEAASKLTPLLANPADIETRSVRARAHFWLGNAALARHDKRAAEHAWNDALNVDPSFETAELALCELYLDESTPERALARLQPLIARQPQSSEAYRLLGRGLLDKGDPAGAVSAFERYAELRPDDPNGPYLVASALIALGQHAAARKQLERAIALNPEAFEPVRALLSLMAANGQLAEAENRLHIELAQHGRSAKLLTLLGDISAPHKSQKAEQAYREAVTVDAAYTPALLGLGRLYAATQRDGAALLLYQAGLAHAGDPTALWLEIAELHARNGAGAEARFAYEQVLARDPDSVDAKLALHGK